MGKFKTLEFPNTADGQAAKVEALKRESLQGWRVVSETITPGHFKGEKACCLFLIFAPCALLAGHTKGTITVTLQRDVADRPALAPLDPTLEVSREQALARAQRAWGQTADVQTSGSEKIVGFARRQDNREVLVAKGRGATWTEALIKAGLGGPVQ